MKDIDRKPKLVETPKVAVETKKTVRCPEWTKTFVNMQRLSVHLKYEHNASLNTVQPIPNTQPTTSTTENAESESTEDCPLASSSHQNVSGNLLDVNIILQQNSQLTI